MKLVLFNLHIPGGTKADKKDKKYTRWDRERENYRLNYVIIFYQKYIYGNQKFPNWDQTCSWQEQTEEEVAGVAKQVGLSSPAIMTTIFGSVSTIKFMGLGGFSSSDDTIPEAERLRYEQTRMIKATVMSKSIAPRPPKR